MTTTKPDRVYKVTPKVRATVTVTTSSRKEAKRIARAYTEAAIILGMQDAGQGDKLEVKGR